MNEPMKNARLIKLFENHIISSIALKGMAFKVAELIIVFFFIRKRKRHKTVGRTNARCDLHHLQGSLSIGQTKQ